MPAGFPLHVQRPGGTRRSARRLSRLLLGLAAPAVLSVLSPGHVLRAAPSPEESPAMPELVERDLTMERRAVGLLGAGYSSPKVLSGSIGLLVFRQPASYDCTTLCDFKGALFQLEPGLGGGQLNAGYGVVIGEKTKNRFFLSDVYMGFGIKGALLRTWGSPSADRPDRTFLGIEGEFTIIQVNFRLGLFRQVGDDPGDDWKVRGGVGWGF